MSKSKSKGMKWLIRVAKVLGILILLYVVVAIFAPNGYKVERTQEMSASAEAIYEQVYKFENWGAWSPWAEKDATLTHEIEGEDGTVGAKYKWKGDPDISGEGSMTITELIPNEKISYDLHFIDMDMHSSGTILIESSEEGKTSVKWWDEGGIPFMFRPMMLFMDMDAMMGADFERGLFKLDSIATIYQDELNNKYEMVEIDFPETYFYGVRKNIQFNELDSAFYADNYGVLGEFSFSNGIEMAGMPVSICYEWNEDAETAIIMPAFPVTDNTIATTEGIEAYTQPACKALVIDYYGPYEETGAAHEQLQNYCDKNGLNASVVMEEFVTDPTTVESMDQVLTKIYYFIDQ